MEFLFNGVLELKGGKIMDKYEKMEGKIVDYVDGVGTIKGKIIGCDKDIGVTIVDNDNPDKYLLCYAGPKSPIHEGKDPGSSKLSNAVMKFLMKHMEAGKIVAADMPGSSYYNGVPEKYCSFGQ